MISCTEFIPAYSELFKYLEEQGGRPAVVKFWEHLSDRYLDNLRELAREHGLRGCWLYWQQTLNEEAADFTMTLDEELGEFRIDMHHCPSKGRLLQYGQIHPYPDYCRHCDLLYRRVLEPLGFSYEIDLSRADRAACAIIVRRGR
ncbi:MAG: hypothetical protein ABR497_00285 [Kiritimatiellia bacterium]|nr:hypothetical protein [Lentisphaerota bacterium]